MYNISWLESNRYFRVKYRSSLSLHDYSLPFQSLWMIATCSFLTRTTTMTQTRNSTSLNRSPVALPSQSAYWIPSCRQSVLKMRFWSVYMYRHFIHSFICVHSLLTFSFLETLQITIKAIALMYFCRHISTKMR